MSAAPELDVRTIDHPGIDPADALAKLSSYTPERPCFLLRSHRHDDDGGRYSIVGYRVLRCELLPPGVDANEVQSAEHDDAEPAAGFAQGLALGGAGYFAANNGSLKHGVQLFGDDSCAGNFAVDAAVAVYDHVEGNVTVAARKKGNQAERLIWELEHGPEVAPPPQTDASASPDGLQAMVAEKQLIARANRAAGFLGDEVSSVVLAQMFHAPMGTSDPLDAYRAWCALSKPAYSYYFDFGSSPVAARVRVYGVSDELLYLRRPGEERRLTEIYQHLPYPSTIGEPPVMAAKLIRRLEENARFAWGGAAGYICPGGAAAFVLADRIVTAQSGAYYHNTGARLVAGDDPADLSDRVRANAAPALAAIKAAQNRSYAS